VVSGRVQGVGYRDFVDTYAKEYDLSGWIQNRTDGKVEMVLQGAPENLRACIEVLNEGSVLAHVEDISINWRTPQKQFDTFKVLPS
jgi:acylphosphatase